MHPVSTAHAEDCCLASNTLPRQFNALLGIAGMEITKFLGRHKGGANTAVGFKMIKSATVFAVDSVKTVAYGPPRGEQHVLIKWPAIIWELCDNDVEVIAVADKYEAEYVNASDLHKKDEQGCWLLPDTPSGPRLAQHTIENGNREGWKFSPRVYLPVSELMAQKKTPGNMVVGEDERDPEMDDVGSQATFEGSAGNGSFDPNASISDRTENDELGPDAAFEAWSAEDVEAAIQRLNDALDQSHQTY